MKKSTRQRDVLLSGLLAVLAAWIGPLLLFQGDELRAQEETPTAEIAVPAECTYFTGFAQHSVRGPALWQRTEDAKKANGPDHSIAAEALAVAGALPAIADGPAAQKVARGLSLIDFYIFWELEKQGISPAHLTNDAEFLRRVTLDLTGRIPTAAEVVSFQADTDPQKRSRRIDQLLDSPEWVDRWAMWLGDLLKNNIRSTQVTRYAQGRDAFNRYLWTSLEQNKPYNQLVAELITAAGDSFEQGETNFTVGGIMSMGPVQDTYDKQWVQVATTFLGLKNFDCLLCHNGSGHLDAVNLWGSQVTRYQAWELAAFFSRTRLSRSSQQSGSSYVVENRTTGGYTLNTNSGNRPARQPAEGQSRTVTPRYLFSGRQPGPSENYRLVLAQEVTADFQFARATANYLWAHFFGVGIVDPPDAFDLARLDPQKPPPEPWTVQPSHPELLDELARFVVARNYDLKALMREISNSQTYQLSSRYAGEWNPTYARLFARHLARRLDSEELHDALVQSSGVPDPMRVGGFPEPIPWAMQLPDTQTPGGAVGTFLNTFLRGDRDENPRRGDLSVIQALTLMNDPFIIQRVRASTANGLLARLLAAPMGNPELVDTLFLTVLSRHPTPDESVKAMSLLQTGNRRTQAEDLLWSLYNKVDFVFNY